jgi:hypothetical protein
MPATSPWAARSWTPTVVQARKPRLSQDEKAMVKGGAVPEGWSQAKRAQIDTEGRWTLKRGRKRSVARVEHVFAAQQCRLGLVIRSIGLAAPPPGSVLPTWSPTCAASSGSRPGPPWPEPARSPNRSPDRNTNVFDRRQTAPNARSSPQITSTNRFFEVSSCSVHPTPRAHSIRKLLIPYWTTRKL